MSKSQRSVIARFTEGDIARGSLERCLAVLLREGMDLRALTQFEGLTRNRLRETVESVIRRVHLRMDKPDTPPNASKIKRRYRDSMRHATQGEKPMSFLDAESVDIPGEPEDGPCGALVDWDALEDEELATNQEDQG